MARDGELVCCKTDLGLNFSHGGFQLGQSAVYLCNQRIYSERHAQRRPPQIDRVSATWPLRCVEYWSSEHPCDQALRDRWLASMRRRYELVDRRTYPISYIVGRDQNPSCVDQVEMFVFIPRGKAKESVSGIHSR